MNSSDPHTTRIVVPLNADWRFRPKHVDRAWLRGGWSPEDAHIDLPHCWNETDTFQLGLAYHQGDGAYGCRFEAPTPPPATDAGIWQLRTEGFYGDGDLWLNRQRISGIDGQYLGLCIDVTRHLRAGQPNTLGLRLSNRYRRYVLPGKRNPDFLLYGGLSGRALLMHLPTVHLDDASLHVTCNDPLNACPTVDVAVVARKASPTPSDATLRVSISRADGTVVAMHDNTRLHIPGRGEATACVGIALRDPIRWELAQPHCYRVTCELLLEGRPVDLATTRFGVREARFDGQRGFFLNGTRVPLHGVNRHESMPGFGHALPEALHRADAEGIKQLGLNFVRLSHYPQHPAFLNACDDLGLLVYAEIASWKSVRPGWWAVPACRQLRAMITRDRNHPSIILWGFGNESRSRLVFRRMARIAKALDPGRATVYAENHLHRGIRWRTLRQTDVLGVNYELDRLDDAHARSRDGALVVSEISNCAYTQRGDEAAELRQLAAIVRDTTRLTDKPWVAGYAIWCWTDYGSQRKGRCTRRSGIVDAWRLPKLAAAYLQAHLTKTPCLHLAGNWAQDAAAGERTVHVFSNATQVTLNVAEQTIANGPAMPHLTIAVPYRPEPLVATAVYANGTSLTATLEPHGPAEAVAIEADRNRLSAADRPTVGITIHIRDAAGRAVPNHAGRAHVTCRGPGHPRLFTADGSVELAGGIGRFFVTTTGLPGTIALVCAVAGLEVSTATIECV